MSPFIRTIAFTITAGLLGAASQPAHAANFVVTTNADSGVGSLRWALQQAALTPLSMDTITFNLPANALTISPLIRPSRPTTMFGLPVVLLTHWPKAAVHSTMSCGVRLSPGRPPMVPRKPDIDLISGKIESVFDEQLLRGDEEAQR